jgi:hypothetical protein
MQQQRQLCIAQNKSTAASTPLSSLDLCSSKVILSFAPFNSSLDVLPALVFANRNQIIPLQPEKPIYLGPIFATSRKRKDRKQRIGSSDKYLSSSSRSSSQCSRAS